MLSLYPTLYEISPNLHQFLAETTYRDEEADIDSELTVFEICVKYLN